MEVLRFLFTTKCGDKFAGEMVSRGHRDPHKILDILLRRKDKECEECRDVRRFELREGEIVKIAELRCPAKGILTHRNDHKISYPLASDNN